MTPEIVAFVLSLCATSVAVTRSLNNSIDGVRRQLDDRLDQVTLQLKDIDRIYQLKDIKFEQDILRLEGYCNGNKELIGHRTARAEAAFARLEAKVANLEADLHNRLRNLEMREMQNGKASH